MDETETQKTKAGFTEEEWKDRFVSYMMLHSDSQEWQARESADAAWDMSDDDEEPTDCAHEELSMWE